MTSPKSSFANNFFASFRFTAGVVGTMLIGGALANLAQGAAVDRVGFEAVLGCVGVILFDPRGRWSAFAAGLVGSFGLFGLIDIGQPLLAKRVSSGWTDISVWRFALYTTCLAAFFLWSYRRNSVSSKG
jgi:hypothetical protein